MLRRSWQAGFSLIELMVSLVIGLVITLAAGTLLIDGIYNFQQVGWLRDKQSAVTVATEVLARDIRRALHDPGGGTNNPKVVDQGGLHAIRVRVENRGDSSGCDPGVRVDKTFWVDSSGVGEEIEYVLMVEVDPLDSDCGIDAYSEPVVAGFAAEGGGGLEFEDLDPDGEGGWWQITMHLAPPPKGRGGSVAEELVFRVVNRQSAARNASNTTGS